MTIVKKGCKNPAAVHASACCPTTSKLKSTARAEVEDRVYESTEDKDL